MVLNRLFSRRGDVAARFDSRPRGARGKRLYAIGDIHGCADALGDLLGQIVDDHTSRAPRQSAIVCLGDLIDRGPDSRGVIDMLRRFDVPGLPVHVIAGNHEEMFLRGIKGSPTVLPAWLRHGGDAFCQSYGLDPTSIRGLDVRTMRQRIIRAIPQEDVAFLEAAVERVRFGDYLLVHAGINPELDLDEQESRDLRWIREPFLESNADFGCVVVHGHTISPEIVERPNRIGLDTGAYRTGVLTALCIEDADRHYLSAHAHQDHAHK